MNANWINQVGDLLGQYGGTAAQRAPDTVYNDFDQLAQTAPQSALAEGLSEAFRSDRTPPFGQMLGQLFGQSSGYQRANILNTLIATLGPTLVAQFLSRRGDSAWPDCSVAGKVKSRPNKPNKYRPKRCRRSPRRRRNKTRQSLIG